MAPETQCCKDGVRKEIQSSCDGQEEILPAESCCLLCFHTLHREAAFYKGIYFYPNTPPVNKIPLSPTFK